MWTPFPLEFEDLSKWKKVGSAMMSQSEKVVVLRLDDSPDHLFVIDAQDLWEVVTNMGGRGNEILDILERA